MKLITILKNLFKSQDERSESWSKTGISNSDNKKNHKIKTMIIDIAPNIYLVHRGARVCVGKGVIEDGLTARLNHVGKLIGMGHESILEHSNIVSMISIPKEMISNGSIAEDLIEIMTNFKYCKTVSTSTSSDINILIGGSIRGYLNVVRETSRYNTILNSVKEIIYASIEKQFLKPLIDMGLLDEKKCTYFPDGEVTLEKSKVTQIKSDEEKDYDGENYDADCKFIYDPKEIKGERVDRIYSGDPCDIFKNISKYGFNKKDAYSVTTISFLIHDVSRSCANQMTRHRVGISQESQRYVTHDYQKEKDFIDPIKMNISDRYINLNPKVIKNVNTKYEPFATYKYLISNAILKEDARAWLPMNVTTKLMMTFTYTQLAHFCNLRTNKAAQKEIRFVANEMLDHKNISLCNSNRDFYDTCLTPYALNDDETEEPIIEEEVDEIVEDYTEEEPTKLVIKTPEDAKEYLERNEQYKNL